MFKKLLLGLIAVIALSNVATYTMHDKKPTHVRLKKALMGGAAYGGIYAALFSLPCLLWTDFCAPLTGTAGFLFGSTVAGISIYLPVSEKNITWQLTTDNSTVYQPTTNQRNAAAYKYATTRGWVAALATGIFTGVFASCLCYAGFTDEDLKNLIRS